jgi:8-oxo-dGTP pyrophosphatase MutT (NUDIX family)
MATRHGQWTIESTEQKYANEFIQVYEDQVKQPDGEPGIYGTVRMKAGVAVLPIDSEGMVYLTEQYRYAYGNQSLEVVSGGIEGDEPPKEAARRELREEVGILADEWIDLGLMHMDTSIVNAPVHLFVAKDLSTVEQDQDATEHVKTVRVSFEEAVQKTLRGEIVHSPSIILILKAQLAALGSV